MSGASFRPCPACLGVGFTLDPEAPDLRDQTCLACRGVGVVDDGDRPLHGAEFWFALAVMAATLPLRAVRDLAAFGPGHAWMMARVRLDELRTAWGARPGGDMPEVGEEWFRKAKLRLPDEGEPR